MAFSDYLKYKRLANTMFLKRRRARRNWRKILPLLRYRNPDNFNQRVQARRVNRYNRNMRNYYNPYNKRGYTAYLKGKYPYQGP